MMMKSLKSIFSSCSSLSVSTQKNKRERVKSEHFLRFWNAASLLWIFLNSNEEPPRLCSLLCFLSRTSDERRKNKNEETSYLIVHVRDVFVAVDVVQPLLPFRFFQLFQLFQLLFRLIGFGRVSTRRTRRHLFFSLSIRFALPQRAKKRSIDESALWCLFLSSTTKKEREKDVRSVYNKRRAVIKTFAQQQQKKQQKQRRALCLKCNTHHSRYFFWRRGMKFQKFEPKNCLKMELNSILEWKGKRVLNYCMKLLVLH